MNKAFSLIFFLLLSAGFATAQMLEPVKWSFSKTEVSDSEFDLVFQAKIDPEWHLYAQDIDEGGPIPTTFEFEDIKGYELVGKVKEFGELKEENSALFSMMLRYYKKEVKFVQRIKLTDAEANAAGYLTFMTCNDKTCLPPTDVDFNFELKEGAASPETDEDRSDTEPTENSDVNSDAETLVVNVSEETDPEIVVAIEEEPVLVEEETVSEPEPVAEEEITDSEAPESEVSPEPTTDDQPKESSESETTEEASTTDAIPVINSDFGNLGIDDELKLPDTGEGILEPVEWSWTTDYGEASEATITFRATVKDGWSIYSQFVEEGGPLPTEIEFEEENKIKKTAEATEAGNKKEGFDKIFGMNVVKYENEMVLTQQIEIGDVSLPVSGFISYMTCNDDKCIPKDYEFIIKPGQTESGSGITSIPKPGEGAGADLDIGISDQEPVVACVEKKDFSNLWLIFLFGFLGGMVALITPCVFPMIPLTVSFFTKQSQSKAKGISNAIIYGLAIIVIYVSLGTSLTAIFGPQIMNALSTDAILNMLFFFLFVIFAISFFGYFEITLPSSWANRTDRLADKGGLLGIFFMAFTLGIVSFSCTGPIIGTLLVEAGRAGSATLGRITLGPPIGMLGFSLALALPFALFAAFPGWLNSLPRSGGWMNTVKVVLGFLELALALKFLSVVDMTYHWNFLKFEPFMASWFLIFGGLGAYLLGLIKFPHDPPKVKLSIPRVGIALASLVFAAYLGWGLFTYTSIPLLSGLAPPVHYNFFKPTDCPHNLDCYKDFGEAFVKAQEEKKPMLIDFTGYGCVNCRKMEEHVWPNPNIMKKLQQDVVLVSLYVDDKTKLEQPYVSQFDGKKKRTVGNYWADFQAINFGVNSQPYYALVSHEGKLLNNPVGYTPNSAEFNYFLECGLDAFHESCSNCTRKPEKLGLNE